MRKWIGRVALSLLALIVIAAVSGTLTLRWIFLASLPVREGSLTLTGLTTPVEVLRDHRGVPLLRTDSTDFVDLARAQGFVHAQERFWQMDTMRRRAAGRLAELIGDAALYSDRSMRRFRFNAVASQAYPKLPAEHRAWIEAYAAGVNEGLAALGARPPEYVALFLDPEPWTPQDTLLVALVMHHSLSFGHEFEWRYDAIKQILGQPIADFLHPETTRFDAPLVGSPGDPDGLDTVPQWKEPSPAGSTPPRAEAAPWDELDATRPAPLGSNSWAVAGSRTADGRAILANDMHLAIMVPSTWFHIQLEWRSRGEPRRAAGVSLPGVPGLITGSNGDVAWGFTNVTGDFEDYIRLELDPADSNRYRVGPEPDDFEPFTHEIEPIDIRFRSMGEAMPIRMTRWGPVVRQDSNGAPMVLKWAAINPETINVNILRMIDARTIEEAIEIGRSWWGPPQNITLADSAGRVAWVVSGWIPERRGYDGREPTSWTSPDAGWAGPIDESRRPVLLNPDDGLILTANARNLPLEQARIIGRCWSMGDRQARIAELLKAGEALDERDLLEMQLDTRVAMMDNIRAIIARDIPVDFPDRHSTAAREAAIAWQGRAESNSVGFRVIAAYRNTLINEIIIKKLNEACRPKFNDFSYWWFQDDEPLLRLLEERPPSWLSKADADWNALLTRCWKKTLDSLRAVAGEDPSTWRWGLRNRVRSAHAFSLALPQLSRWLDMPRDEQSGHTNAVRVLSPGFGASQRLVVSPGLEEDGILHLPCGQSGHFLSEHYRDGHAAWHAGEPTPLLAGPPVSRLVLNPAR